MNFSDFLNFVSQNFLSDFPSPFALFTTIIIPIIIHLKSKRTKQPIYRIKTNCLVKEGIGKIEFVDIFYCKNKIDNFSVSKIMIWNEGNEIINKTDIAEKDKFRIEIDKEYKILGYKLIFQKKLGNDFNLIKVGDNILEITFDYFDYEDGFIAEIYHTAPTGDSLNVKGDLKGAKSIIRNQLGKKVLPLLDKALNSVDNLLTYLMKKRLLGVSLLLVSVLLATISVIFASETNKVITTMYVFLAILYLFISLFVWKIRLPKGFESFEDEF